jgi:hypothetical protein
MVDQRIRGNIVCQRIIQPRTNDWRMQRDKTAMLCGKFEAVREVKLWHQRSRDLEGTLNDETCIRRYWTWIYGEPNSSKFDFIPEKKNTPFCKGTA